MSAPVKALVVIILVAVSGGVFFAGRETADEVGAASSPTTLAAVTTSTFVTVPSVTTGSTAVSTTSSSSTTSPTIAPTTTTTRATTTTTRTSQGSATTVNPKAGCGTGRVLFTPKFVNSSGGYNLEVRVDNDVSKPVVVTELEVRVTFGDGSNGLASIDLDGASIQPGASRIYVSDPVKADVRDAEVENVAYYSDGRPSACSTSSS